jgi:hypothetical protein
MPCLGPARRAIGSSARAERPENVLTNVAADQFLTIREGHGVSAGGGVAALLATTGGRP